MWEAETEANTAGEGAALPLALAALARGGQNGVIAQGGGAAETALLSNSHWDSAGASGATAISFSFANAASTFCDAYGPGGFQATLREFGAADKQQVREALAAVEAVCNVHFVEVDDNAGGSGTLRYGYSQGPADMGFAGFAFFPSASPQGGDVWIAQSQAAPQWDGYRPYLLLHETLHALGLKHPFSGADTLAAQADAIPNTVMSYSAIAGMPLGALSRFPAEPMPLDVQALQDLYGTAAHNDGDTAYDLSSARWGDGFHVIWDTGGTDVLDASACAAGVTLDLRAGAHSDIGNPVYAFVPGAAGQPLTQATYSFTLAIAQGSVIEDAVGSAQADILIGNAGANHLQGDGGDDQLAGLGGGDLLDGGAGTDTVVYSGNRADYQLAREGAGYAVRHIGAGEEADHLVGVERLAFADSSVALDLDGHAGEAARLLGALLGKQALSNAVPLGMALGWLDSGLSNEEVAAIAVQAVLGDQPFQNTALVELLYRNVTGHPPQAEELMHWTSLLLTGAMTPGSLALLAADSEANRFNIDLVGLSQSGLAYVPDYA